MNTWQKIALAVLMLAAGQLHAEDAVHYYYTDPQGTVLAKADATGNVIATYDYAPYGSQALGAPPSGPGYTGHVNDPDTGLVYMQARYYDPGVGRFLSVDPVTPSPGNTFNFNRYDYTNNNPINHTDPDGRNLTEALGGLFYETGSFVTGNGFHGSQIVGALKDGYNGEGGGVLHALGQDATTISVAAGGVGALRAAGALAVREAATEGAGVVYKRINPETLEEYVGKAKSIERYIARQGEHNRKLGIDHEYKILGRAEPGKELSYLEETQIRANGWLQKEGGTLANKIHAMSQKNYNSFQGTFRVEGRIDSINLGKKLDGG
ncbi:RHS repeat-associated core domain-containing protein [Rhodanobacter sp. UC4451_H18]